MEQGKLEEEQAQFDFHRIITERVSKEVRVISTTCTEQINLLRYSLRLNSTRMRRGAWQ